MLRQQMGPVQVCSKPQGKDTSETMHEYTLWVKKKLGHLFAAYNFRNIEQIFTKLGRNHVLFMLNIMP